MPKIALLYCSLAKLLKKKKQFNNLTIKQLRLGFSLIEMLVVITIIGILLASGTYSYTNAQRKGRDGKRKAELKSVQQALELYFQTFGQYAANDGGGKIVCYGGTALTWGTDAFTCQDGTNNPNFLDKLPKDPKLSTNEYYYNSTGASAGSCGTSSIQVCTSYTIFALLENTNDPDTQAANQPCLPTSPYNYCVKNP